MNCMQLYYEHFDLIISQVINSINSLSRYSLYVHDSILFKNVIHFCDRCIIIYFKYTIVYFDFHAKKHKKYEK